MIFTETVNQTKSLQASFKVKMEIIDQSSWALLASSHSSPSSDSAGSSVADFYFDCST